MFLYSFKYTERSRRRQQHGYAPNMYPSRGQGPPLTPPGIQRRNYRPRPWDKRSTSRVIPPEYDLKQIPYEDAYIPSLEKRSIDTNNIGSRSMENIRSRSLSEESPGKKRLTASEERLTDIHKQWETNGMKFHVAVRVRPMTVREIKETAKESN